MDDSIWSRFQNSDFTAIGINIGEDPSLAQAFVDAFDITFLVLLDLTGSVASHYRPPGAGASPFPLDFIVDQDGVIRYWKSEYDPVAMIAVIEGLLGDTIPPTTPGSIALAPDGTLSWSPSFDNVGVDHYRIYRHTVAYFEPQGLIPVATTTATCAQFPGNVGNPLVNYFFRVTATDPSGNESAASLTVGEFDVGYAPRSEKVRRSVSDRASIGYPPGDNG